MNIHCLREHKQARREENGSSVQGVRMGQSR
jgi:hypothetical protein